MKLPIRIAQPGKLVDADGETVAQLRNTTDAAVDLSLDAPADALPA